MVAEHVVKAFPLDGRLAGISDEQLRQHRDVLYAGAVKRLNDVRARLAKAPRGPSKDGYTGLAALHREEQRLRNGVLLHEAYFASLGGKGGPPDGALAAAIGSAFGSVDAWREEFRAAAMSATGFAILGWDVPAAALRVAAVGPESEGMPVSFVPVLVIDVAEHAFFIDYGTKKAEYVKAFTDNVDWDGVGALLLHARGGSAPARIDRSGSEI